MPRKKGDAGSVVVWVVLPLMLIGLLVLMVWVIASEKTSNHTCAKKLVAEVYGLMRHGQAVVAGSEEKMKALSEQTNSYEATLATYADRHCLNYETMENALTDEIFARYFQEFVDFHQELSVLKMKVKLLSQSLASVESVISVATKIAAKWQSQLWGQ